MTQPPIVKGYFSWNWSGGSYGQSDANIGVAFTGLIDVQQAIQSYVIPYSPELVHGNQKGPWLTLGGGNAAGMFSLDAIEKIQQDLPKVVDANYSGIVFDIEEANGDGDELIEAFA